MMKGAAMVRYQIIKCHWTTAAKIEVIPCQLISIMYSKTVDYVRMYLYSNPGIL